MARNKGWRYGSCRGKGEEMTMPTNREARQWDKVQDMALLRQIAANRRLAVENYLAAKAAKELSLSGVTKKVVAKENESV